MNTLVKDDRRQHCKCHGSGYCPLHGTYTPVPVDLEIRLALENHDRPRLHDGRVVKKRLAD